MCYVGWGPRHCGPSFDSILTCDHRQGLLCTGLYFSNLKQSTVRFITCSGGGGSVDSGGSYTCVVVLGEQGVNGKPLCLPFNFALNLKLLKKWGLLKKTKQETDTWSLRILLVLNFPEFSDYYLALLPFCGFVGCSLLDFRPCPTFSGHHSLLWLSRL